MLESQTIPTYPARLRAYKAASIAFTAVAVLLAVILVPKAVPYLTFRGDELAGLLTQLFLAALFIERSVEVVMACWREKGREARLSAFKAEKHKAAAQAGGGPAVRTTEMVAAEAVHDIYTAETKSLALLTAFALGIAVSALGIRSLEMLLDPQFFDELGPVQQRLFYGIDTLVTGALLGGGSDGIHKVLSTATGFFENIREKQKKGDK